MGTGTSEVRAARRERIRRFAAAQEKRRGFVRLADLAEFRARKDDEDFGVNDERLHLAFVDLGVSILKGDFERRGASKSKILCLSEEMPAMRLAGAFLAARRRALGDDRTWVSAYVAHCWAPLDDMLRWCEDKRVKPPPAWLRPSTVETTNAQKDAPPTEYGFRVLAARHPQPLWAIDAPEWAEPYLRRAHCGTSTPDEIEAELAAKGLPPLAFTPDPARFDSMAQPWWTLPMAAAWIIWRTPHAVRRVWHEYRRKTRHWIGPQQLEVWEDRETSPWGYQVKKMVTGYALGPLGALHLFQVLLRAELGDPEDGSPVLSGEATRAQLWARLQSGALVVEGVRHLGNERAPLRDAEWIDLDPYYNDDWPTDSMGNQSEKVPRFTSLRVRSAEVVRLWPIRGGADGPAQEGDESERLERKRLEDFKRPEWTLGQTLSWIAYRDSNRFGCFSDRRSTLVLFYKYPPEPALLDPECQTTLRAALVEGRIAAIQDRRPIPKESWVGSSLWDFEEAWFRRIDVLSLWPEQECAARQASHAAQAVTNLTSSGTSEMRAAIQRAFSKLWPEGPPEGLMVQERDAKIIAFLKETGLRAPSSQTIYRALKPPPQKLGR